MCDLRGSYCSREDGRADQVGEWRKEGCRGVSSAFATEEYEVSYLITLVFSLLVWSDIQGIRVASTVKHDADLLDAISNLNEWQCGSQKTII